MKSTRLLKYFKNSQMMIKLFILTIFWQYISSAVNRVNVTSNFYFYYQFLNFNSQSGVQVPSTIQFNFVYKTGGYAILGFGTTMYNTDLIRVYYDSNGSPKADDMWSVSYNPVNDTTVGGTNDVTLQSGSRSEGVTNILVQRNLDTGDTAHDANLSTLYNNKTQQLVYSLGTTDTLNFGQISSSTFNATFTTTQICHSSCLTCSGPDSNNCLTCSTGYFTDPNSLCQQCTSNCNSCTSQSSCNTCATGYYLLKPNNNLCVTCTDTNMYKDVSLNFCTMCQTYCGHCSSPTVCDYCPSGAYFNSSNTCYFCGDTYNGCNSCNSTTTCSSCNNLYYMSNGICVKCVDGKFYSSSAGQCLNCDSSCLTCNGPNNTNCLTCGSGQYLDSATSACLYSCNSNCKTCYGSGDNQCYSCNSPQILLISKCISISNAYASIASLDMSYVSLPYTLVSLAQTLKYASAQTSPSQYCIQDIDCSVVNGLCVNYYCSCHTGYFGFFCELNQTQYDTLNTIFGEAIQKYNTLAKSDVSLTFLQTTLDIFENLTTSRIFWNKTTLKSSIDFITNLLNQNINQISNAQFQQSINTLANFISNINFQSNIIMLDKTILKQTILDNLELIFKTQLRTITQFGQSLYFNSTFTEVKLTKYNLTNLLTLDSNNLTFQFNQNPFLMKDNITRASFPTSATNTILTYNNGNEAVYIKSQIWKNVNPNGQNVEQNLIGKLYSVEVMKINQQDINVINLNVPIILTMGVQRTRDTTKVSVTCYYYDTVSSIWSQTGLQNSKFTETSNYFTCYSTHLTDFAVMSPLTQTTIQKLLNALWYLNFNFGFFLVVSLIGINLFLIPTLLYKKNEKRMNQYTFNDPQYRIQQRTDRSEIDQAQIGTDQEMLGGAANLRKNWNKGKKAQTDSLNPWMVYSIYSIVRTDSQQVSLQKFTILNIIIISYPTTLAVVLKIFGHFTWYGFIISIAVAIGCAQGLGFVYGAIAVCMRKQKLQKVYIIYWIFFLACYSVMGAVISWIMATQSPSNSRYWLAAFFISAIADTLIIETFFVCIGKAIQNKERKFAQYTKVIRMKGYYD